MTGFAQGVEDVCQVSRTAFDFLVGSCDTLRFLFALLCFYNMVFWTLRWYILFSPPFFHFFFCRLLCGVVLTVVKWR